MTEKAIVLKRYDEFQERLVSLIDEFKDAIAPDWDKVAEAPCYHDDDCECLPNDNITPTEFVLITNWTDFDKNRAHVTGCISDHLMPWHTKGLLEHYRDRLRSI
jgi:hypothetical protein